MSASYYSGVILGLTLPEICDVKIKSNSFAVHDRKGKPTGEFDQEKSVVITYKGVTEVLSRLYTDAIEEILNIESPFELQDLNDYDDENANDIVVGLKITELDYNEYSALKQIDEKYLNEMKKVFIEKFNLEPKIYFYFQIC